MHLLNANKLYEDNQAQIQNQNSEIAELKNTNIKLEDSLINKKISNNKNMLKTLFT
jgi:hypothetical protein